MRRKVEGRSKRESRLLDDFPRDLLPRMAIPSLSVPRVRIRPCLVERLAGSPSSKLR